jgi:hypothetical protein
MKYLSKKIIFMLILAGHAHQAQAAQTVQVSRATQAAELAAQTLQSAKYYWNYLKKSMRAGTAQAITVAQKHPKIVLALTAVSVLFLAKKSLKKYFTPAQVQIGTLAGAFASSSNTTANDSTQAANNKHFNVFKASNKLRAIPVLWQWGLTCGVHAVKNALAGLHYFDNPIGTAQLMLNQTYYNDTIPKKFQGQSNLQENEVQELADQVFRDQAANSVYVIQPTVATEETATRDFRLSQPSYTVSFIYNTGGHYVAFTVRKENGAVTDIICMDSMNGGNYESAAQNLFNMCSKNTQQIMRELEEYNNNVSLGKFVDRINGYKERGQGKVTEDNLETMAERFFEPFQIMVFTDDKIVQKSQSLDATARKVLLERLKDHLSPEEITALEQKVETVSQTQSTTVADPTCTGGGGSKK